MTDKKLKVSNAAYTELSIQIAVLQASVDKLLQLAMKPEQEIVNVISLHEHRHVGVDTPEVRINPPQWSNESYKDYLKRIGQYNEAQSDDEYYGEVYK